MAIVDVNGNPIELNILEEAQTAKIGNLHTTYAEHPSRGLTPAKLARILEEAERGYLTAQSDLFLDMEEKDPHIFAEMNKRRMAVMTLPYQIKPPRNATPDEKSQVDFLTDLVADLPDFEDLIFDMTDGVGKGFAAIETEWNRLGNVWTYQAFNHRPQSWFQLNQTNQNELRLRDNTAFGAALQPFGWIMHTHKAKSGYLGRSALFRVLAWPFLFKNYSVRDLAEFLEIYGLPLRLGKYPVGADDKEKSKLLQAVIQIGHDAAGIIPQGMEIDFKEAAKGSNDPFMAMINWCEKSVSKAVLGGTLTSQADGNSSTNALGNVHNEVRHDLLEADVKQIEATLKRQLLYPLLALNWTKPIDPRRMPSLIFDTRQPEDLKIYADSLPKLVSIGLPVPARWAGEKLNIPMPIGDEPVLSASKTPVTQAAGRRALAALNSLNPMPPDELEALVDTMLDDWQPVIDDPVSQLQKLISECADLNELAARLPELAGKLDVSKLQETVTNGATISRLYGRVTGK